ncbi:MAG: 3-isopropylmalate dehydrogenase [Blautia sp.]|nr:3-isopropylmalate dehydrogenase [Blautia sp.]MDY4000868.1 3-isopropylmalate dehydrogenase [Blautia sp.]
MDYTTKESEVFQWHPAFYAGLQIELADDSDNLIFENEHQLGTKPMEIDVLIVKKEKDLPVKKNIGRIFRMHNIIEYKSPSDHLSIDDFYKVYGYACFYKSDTGIADEVPVNEITITFVTEKYPVKLFHHLQKERGFLIEKPWDGIYYIKGDYIPIQILVTRQLSQKENLWLRSLTNRLEDPAGAEHLIEEYGKHKNNHLYASVMNIIVRANRKTFEGVNVMCDALKEIVMESMKEELDAAVQTAKQTAMQEGMQAGMQAGMQEALIGSILDFLADLGEVPEDIQNTLRNEKDIALLKKYNKKAASVKSIAEFRDCL